MWRYAIASGGAWLLVAGMVVEGCGPGDACEVTLTCAAPTGGSGADGGAGGAGGGAGGASSLPDGEACDAGPSCTSGLCVDGVCCASACTGICEACNVPTALGVCTLHAPATDPDEECAAAAICDGAGECASGDHAFSTMWGDDVAGVWVNDIAVDAARNVVVVGYFNHDFIAGNSETLTYTGYDTAWVAKFDENGGYAWAKPFGKVGSSHFVSRVEADASGNLIVSGTYLNGPGPGLSSCGGIASSFVVKLDGQGQTQWCQPTPYPQRAAIATAPNGDVIVAGRFTGTLDFGGATSPMTAQNNGIYIARFGALGNAKWATSFNNVNAQSVEDVAVDDADHVTLFGLFDTSASFGGAPLTSVAAGLYVARFQPTGEPEWSKGFGDDVFAARGTVSANGDVLVSGRFLGTVDFGGGPFVANGADGFVAVLDGAGDTGWAHHATGVGALYEPTSVAFDAAGNALVSAKFEGSLTLAGTAFDTSSMGLLLGKFATDGTTLWSKSFSCDEHNNAGVGADTAGDVWWGGDYFGTIDFGGGPLFSTSENAFLVKYAR